MRLYELDQDFDLTKKAKKKLFPSGPTFSWDPAKKQWLNPDGTQVARDVHFDLMKSVGLDPQGNKLKPGMIDKIKGAWAKSGAGIDPKASALGKVMGRVGGALGNALGKLVRPKDTVPDEGPKGNTAGATGALSGDQEVQDVNTWIKNLMPYFSKPGVDKTLLVKELVNFMASKKDTPAWVNAKTSMKSILKRAGIPPAEMTVALQKIEAGEIMDSMQFAFINSLLEATGLSFEDLGLEETVIETNGVKRYIVEDMYLTKLRKLAGI